MKLTLATLTVSLVAAMAAASAGAVTEIWCAQPGGGYVCKGTDGADLIHGTSGADTIKGLKGNDEIHGLAGADTIYGNPGGDDLFGGGAGSSTGSGNLIYGGDGNDLLDLWNDANGGCPWGTLDGGAGSDNGRGWNLSGHQTYFISVETIQWGLCP